MEDFQSSWQYDGDKMSTSFLPQSSSLLENQAYNKDKTYEFESPIFRPAQASKPDQSGYDRQVKEEEFVLDSAGGLKIEHQEINPQYFPNQAGGYPDLLSGNHYLGLQEYDVEAYQIRRSRGPSFNFNKERRGSEDFFGAGVDFMRFFRNYGDQFIQETEGLQPQAVKTEFEGGYQGQDDNMLGMYNFQNLPQGKDVHVKEHELDQGIQDNCNNAETSEEAAADESTLQLSVQGSDAEHSVGNPLSSTSNGEGDYEPVIKKKRKTNGNQIVEVVPKVQETKVSKMPKLKKSKSEIDKNALYAVTPKGNSLSLKLVKIPEAKESETPSKPKIKKSSTKEGKIAESVPAQTKIEEVTTNTNEKPAEMPVNTGAPADQIPLMRSKSSILSSLFQGKTGSFGDLVAGLGLPAEVEEMLNSSKFFNNIQSSMSRKIGPLTVEERRAKVEKYFEKRKNRTWSKRINYDCRKRVADSRLRFKGRFVTKTQAFGMLAEEGIFPDPNKITESEIKELLEEKFGSDPVKKKEKEGDGRKNNGRPKKQPKLEGNMKIKEEDIQVKYELEEESLEDTKSPTGSFDDDF